MGGAAFFVGVGLRSKIFPGFDRAGDMEGDPQGRQTDKGKCGKQEEGLFV